MNETPKPYECTACGSRMFAKDGLPRNTYECENDECGQRSVIVETGLKTLRYDVPRIALPQTEVREIEPGLWECPHCGVPVAAEAVVADRLGGAVVTVYGLHWECPHCARRFMRPKAQSARGSNASAGNPALDLVRAMLPDGVSLDDEARLTIRVPPKHSRSSAFVKTMLGVNPGSPEDESEGGER